MSRAMSHANFDTTIIYSSSPYNAEERSGIVVKVVVRENCDDTNVSEDEGNEVFLLLSLLFKGAPDLSVVVETKPHIFVVWLRSAKMITQGRFD